MVASESNEEILGLYKLGNCIKSTFRDGTKNDIVIDELVSLYCYVSEAAELLVRYDNIDDEDVKFEIGMEYSELIADIEEMVEEANKQGISLYIH
jgi:hypothetical protein